MKICNGCNRKCEIGFEISECSNGKSEIAPSVGGVIYWVYDIYSTGVRRTLFTKFVGTDADKARLIALTIKRAKDIARYCEKQR